MKNPFEEAKPELPETLKVMSEIAAELLDDPVKFFTAKGIEMDIEDHLTCKPGHCHAFGVMLLVYTHPKYDDYAVAIETKPKMDTLGHVLVYKHGDPCCPVFKLEALSQEIYDQI